MFEFMYIIIGSIAGGISAVYWLRLKQKAKTQTIQTQLAATQQQLQETKTELLQTREANLQWAKNTARIETENKNLLEKLRDQKQEAEKIQEKLSLQFKNLANDLLEEKSKKFTDQNKINLEGLLKPLGEKIMAFEKIVAQTNKEGLERNVALRTEIKKLNELNTQITKEAEGLTKAIKGDNRMQGQWGEFILESILEKSGLIKNREYFVQASFTTQEGKRYRPDVIVKLLDAKDIIIDSKVSLSSYEKFFNTEHEAEKDLYLKKHTQSIRKHMQALSDKNYHDAYSLKGLDFVLMFIPIEPAFSLAVQHDAALFNDAYQKNIVIVSPTTLMATLRTIANIWKSEYQNHNTLKIAQLGGALYDKFVNFIQDVKNIGKQIEMSRKVYTEAAKKLYEGRDNLVTKAERLKTLGARANKSLDPKLLEAAKDPDTHDL